MYFAYFDESGDAGYANSPSETFTLACVLVHESQWLEALDRLVSYRRYLRTRFGLPTRAELKAHWLVHRKGPLKHLGLTFAARMSLYRSAMRFQRKTELSTVFAVVINKTKIHSQGTVDPRERAWTYSIQRLERFGTRKGENIIVFPDEGHGDFIRKRIRAMRRFSRPPSAFGNEPLDRKAENILEDPSDRRSDHSYFIQIADLNAYAAFRRVHPGNKFDGAMWDELGSIRDQHVNKVRGGPPGIVSWP